MPDKTLDAQPLLERIAELEETNEERAQVLHDSTVVIAELRERIAEQAKWGRATLQRFADVELDLRERIAELERLMVEALRAMEPFVKVGKALIRANVDAEEDLSTQDARDYMALARAHARLSAALPTPPNPGDGAQGPQAIQDDAGADNAG